ncbi:MAG: damage-inducible protein DinB, partial [Acidimicrobiia bacterium]|nr:damage-inducible protein DinB [Acidimicrobiia bacterium]
GWEDAEDHPRDAGELVTALETTWAILDGCLDRWTPAMLGESFAREYAGTEQIHTRQSVLMRILTHDAYHCGELSQTLDMHHLPQIDLWAPPQDPE